MTYVSICKFSIVGDLVRDTVDIRRSQKLRAHNLRAGWGASAPRVYHENTIPGFPLQYTSIVSTTLELILAIFDRGRRLSQLAHGKPDSDTRIIVESAMRGSPDQISGERVLLECLFGRG